MNRKVACPKCDKLAVVALPDGGIECKGCGYRKPSPYSGPPGLWVRNAREASRFFRGMLSYLFMLLVALSLSACFFIYIFVVEYDGAAVGGGVSLFAFAVMIGAFIAFYWRLYCDVNHRAKEMWSGMDQLDRDAARYIQAEMEHDLGF